MKNLRNLAFGIPFAAAALLAASPASAADYLFDANGDSFSLDFNGFSGNNSNVIPGLTSELLLTLTGGLGTNTLTFSYTLTNTSTVGGASSRVSGFAFDSTADATGTAGADGDFDNIFLGGNYPNAIGSVEVCLTNSGSCAGGGGGGATLSDPATGTFSLLYGSALSSVTLSDFYVRYQSLSDLNGVTSASGEEVPGVPEPATWAMLLIGFGAIGGTLRARKANNAGQRLRVA
jgi:hypothetical protein